MKRSFILFLVGFVVIATAAYMLYLLFDSFHAMYKDWRLGKEMDELEAWSRQQKQSGAEQSSSSSKTPDAQ